MMILKVFLVWLQVFTVNTYQHEKPITQLKWMGKCSQKSRALNDCNWCRCNSRAEYTCDARVCSEVDMFGHFNDAIIEVDPGMEGHGAWRSTKTACEPQVSYRRGGLLCICNEDGTWPNPVCRDVFRILHKVETTNLLEADGQKCTSNKLYVIGCNVCFCSVNGQLDPLLCTKNKCTRNDPLLKDEEEEYSNEDTTKALEEDSAVEIYVDCKPDLKYKLGCKYCTCLRNNRLYCNRCTEIFRSSKEKGSAQSFCTHVKPGQTFSRDCNLCYCDKTGIAYCTVKKCLPPNKELSNLNLKKSAIESDTPFEEENCTPGYLYKKDCNVCYCTEINGSKFFGCTLKTCDRSYNLERVMHTDCVKGTMYELNCLICTCSDVNGVKTQLCHVNPFCRGKKALDESRTDDLKSLHGYCEPLHEYRLDCNTCTCRLDGQTVKCTSYICPKQSPEPVELEIVPIRQNGPACPKGLSYKIECNYCFCLSNGNAICTTVDCSKATRQKLS